MSLIFTTIVPSITVLSSSQTQILLTDSENARVSITLWVGEAKFSFEETWGAITFGADPIIRMSFKKGTYRCHAYVDVFASQLGKKYDTKIRIDGNVAVAAQGAIAGNADNGNASFDLIVR